MACSGEHFLFAAVRSLPPTPHDIFLTMDLRRLVKQTLVDLGTVYQLLRSFPSLPALGIKCSSFNRWVYYWQGSLTGLGLLLVGRLLFATGVGRLEWDWQVLYTSWWMQENKTCRCQDRNGVRGGIVSATWGVTQRKKKKNKKKSSRRVAISVSEFHCIGRKRHRSCEKARWAQNAKCLKHMTRAI